MEGFLVFHEVKNREFYLRFAVRDAGFEVLLFGFGFLAEKKFRSGNLRPDLSGALFYFFLGKNKKSGNGGRKRRPNN